MRESIRDKERLLHILESIDRLQKSQEKHPMDFGEHDPVLYYGYVKLLEIIGEAAYMLTLEFKETHPQTPWKKIVGMRHVLVHGYYQISSEAVKDVVENDLPVLRPQIEAYIKELSE